LEGDRTGRTGKSLDRRNHIPQGGHNLPEDEAPGGVAGPLTSILLGAHNDRADFLEIRHGTAQASAIFTAQGFKTTIPIDLSVGFDGSTCAGQEAAWKVILEVQPLMVFLTPWHEPREEQGYHDARITKDRKKLRQQYKPQLQFCAQVMKYQMQNKWFFILHGPEYSQVWYQKEIKDLGQSALGTLSSFGKVQREHPGQRASYTIFQCRVL